ncbi:MAG: L-threonylcarbamoyladenylate synthase [Proteobacteria bacterium]|nr:L-threonylcarbamoyladenylate synthase [Pseudomonadota bacterium]MDA1357029.1 L-threonylcarbamoyladenylate synthase [Pseudomonadota bacterium]
MPSRGVKRLTASAGDIAIAADILRAGGLVAFPTETVYGLGADARNQGAVRNLFAAKARPPDKPLIVLVQDWCEAARYGVLDEQADCLASACWPGALTLIVNRREPCALSMEINPLGVTVALRAPGNDTALRLLRAFNGPITAPSANPSGAEPPITAGEVVSGLGVAIDAVLDGGPCPGSESTIVDLTGGAPRLLREGAISRRRIAEILYPHPLR